MAIPKGLLSLLDETNGVILTEQANRVGISNERLRLLVKAGELEHVTYGVYSLPEELVDIMYIKQLRRPRIIYSHETALYLHDLTDRDPIRYSVTVPSGYNVSRLREDGFNVFTIKQDAYDLGTIRMKTMFGNEVVVYDLERTICDCLRSRNQMDIAILSDALKRYVRRKDRNIQKLMRFAETFQVDRLLRNYLEVLL
jgi:predicted transcriptional regulator of viral defense system